MLNYYEETKIKNKSLPVEWQSLSSLVEFEEFLQQNWDQRQAFYNDDNLHTKQQFLSFLGQGGIKTQNYVGTIVFKGQQINIFPKIFREDIDDDDTSDLTLEHLMSNLVQWLVYCNKVNFPYLNIKSELDNSENLKELFITIFIKNLNECFSRSGYFQYEDRTEDISSIKGKVDIRDYFTKKYANGVLDKLSCTYSSFEFDNLLNRIIKCTLKRVINGTRPENQKEIRKILTRLSDVEDVRCTAKDCDKVKLSKMHSNYKIILSMCKMFLLNSTTAYTIDNAESFCFLFPTELLFEGFIGGYMQSILGNENSVRLQASELSLIDDVQYEGHSYGRAFTMRHDILCEIKEKGMFVLDTKYKKIPRFEGSDDLRATIVDNVEQKDLYQIAEYAVKRGLKDGYLLYPLFRKENLEPSIPKLIQKITVDGLEHSITIHLVRLPFVFEDDVDKTKLNLKTVIESIFN